jgi:hypothetical protein
MALRKAAEGVIDIPVGEDGDTLTVRQGISKRDFNALLKALPDDYDAAKGFTPGQGGDFTAGLFAALVKGWSSDAPCNVDEYLALDVESAAAVDAAILNHFNDLSPSAAERKSGGDDGEESSAGSEARLSPEG